MAKIIFDNILRKLKEAPELSLQSLLSIRPDKAITSTDGETSNTPVDSNLLYMQTKKNRMQAAGQTEMSVIAATNGRTEFNRADTNIGSSYHFEAYGTLTQLANTTTTIIIKLQRKSVEMTIPAPANDREVPLVVHGNIDFWGGQDTARQFNFNGTITVGTGANTEQYGIPSTELHIDAKQPILYDILHKSDDEGNRAEINHSKIEKKATVMIPNTEQQTLNNRAKMVFHTDDGTIQLFHHESGDYDYTMYYNGNAVKTVTPTDDFSATNSHTFADGAGTKIVEFEGVIHKIDFKDNIHVRSIENWGIITVNRLGSAMQCSSIVRIAAGLDVSNVEDFSFAFSCFTAESKLKSIDLSNWNTLEANNFARFLAKTPKLIQTVDVGHFIMENVTTINRFAEQTEAIITGFQHWDITSVTDATSAFKTNNILSSQDYGEALVNWNKQPLQSGVPFQINASYPDWAATARQNIIDTYGWTIIDNGQVV